MVFWNHTFCIVVSEIQPSSSSFAPVFFRVSWYLCRSFQSKSELLRSRLNMVFHQKLVSSRAVSLWLCRMTEIIFGGFLAVMSQQFGFKVNWSIHTHWISQNQAIRCRLILCLTPKVRNLSFNCACCTCATSAAGTVLDSCATVQEIFNR